MYSLHSNLDNSQLLSYLKITSPIIKHNLHGNCQFLESHDCRVTFVKLNVQIQPKGIPVHYHSAWLNQTLHAHINPLSAVCPIKLPRCTVSVYGGTKPHFIGHYKSVAYPAVSTILCSFYSQKTLPIYQNTTQGLIHLVVAYHHSPVRGPTK